MKAKTKKPWTPKKKILLLNIIELALVGLGGFGGFLGYEISHHWENFVKDYTNFALFKQGYKLNLLIAFPMLICMIITFAVLLKQKKEFVKKHISLDLLIAIACLYFVYAIIEMILLTLIGILIGVSSGEFIIEPIKNNIKEKSDIEQDIKLEYDKEKMRIKAREEQKQQLNNYRNELINGVEL